MLELQPHILLTTKELAQILRISRSSLFKKIKSQNDVPPSFKIGRKRYFKATDVTKWLECKSSCTAKKEGIK